MLGGGQEGKGNRNRKAIERRWKKSEGGTSRIGGNQRSLAQMALGKLPGGKRDQILTS